MIEFDDVRLKYPYEEFELLKGVSFVLRGETDTVLCDSQSGKTSLCRLLCKDIAPTEGGIFVDKKPLNCITLQDLGILYLPSKPVFFENRSVLYNVAYPLKARKIAKTERLERAKSILSQFGIVNYKQKVCKLTQTERKIAALARGLTVKRNIVVFDDFFNNVDEIAPVLAMFGGAHKILVTSDADLATGNAVLLDGGKVVFQGDISEAKSRVESLGWLFGSLRRDNGKQ